MSMPLNMNVTPTTYSQPILRQDLTVLPAAPVYPAEPIANIHSSLSGVHSVIGGASWSNLVADVDNGADFSNARFRAPIKGLYAVSWSAVGQSLSNVGTPGYMQLCRNGSNNGNVVGALYYDFNPQASNRQPINHASRTKFIPLESNDVLSLAASNLTVYPNPAPPVCTISKCMYV